MKRTGSGSHITEKGGEKGTIKAQLTGIEGIGEKINQVLLRKFKSVKNIRVATLQELQETIGKAKGELVYDHFHTEEKS